MMIKPLALLFILSVTYLHPFHMGVCEIAYDRNTKALQVTQKLFVDDLEEALMKYSQENFDITKKENKARTLQLLEKYSRDNVKFVINEKPKEYQFLGFEIEQESLWFYLEITKIRNPVSIKITNTLLFDTFNDQANIIHIEKGGNTKSYKLFRDEPSATAEFN